MFASQQEAGDFFLTRRDLEGFYGEGAVPWHVTDVPPVRVLFDGPEGAFPWEDDIRFLRYVSPLPFLQAAYDVVFKWHGLHWTCIKNELCLQHPRVYIHTPADEIVNLARGGS